MFTVSFIVRQMLRAIAIAACIAFAAGCASGQSAEVAVLTETVQPTVQPVQPRVLEEGMNWHFKLNVHGCKAREVPLDAWTQDGSLQLTSGVATPGYENTEYASFPLFVPDHVRAKVAANGSFNIFVRSPSSANVFIGKNTFTASWTPPAMLWEIKSIEDDAALSGGSPGLRVHASLSLSGHLGETVTIYLVVRDEQENEFTSAEGGPIHLASYKLENIPYAETVWSDLILEVPYSALSGVAYGRRATLTPSIHFYSGTSTIITTGNVHVEFNAGGSLETIRRHLEDEERQVQQEIEAKVKQLSALPPGGKP